MTQEPDNQDEDDETEWLDDQDTKGDDDGEWHERLPVSEKSLAIGLSAVFFALLTVSVVLYAPFLWTVAYFATIFGFVPGLTLFPWITSPFGPGLWLLSEPFARIHLTISQFIRRVGVLVKRASNEYEIGTYLPGSGEVLLSDTRLEVDEDRTSWGLFGKRKFGVTWETGTDLYERVTATEDTDAVADGGSGITVNINAAHRFMERSNEADAISRTEEQAEAKYGGGGEELGGLTMGMLIAMMLVLGSMTTWMML